MTSKLHFTKMHGTGNDFVVLNDFRQELAPDFDFADFAQAACDRHFGIGADGLLLLCAPDASSRKLGATIRMRMWNPDGSEDMCGNGLRCVARLAHNCGAVVGSSFIAQTLAGLRRCEIVGEQIRVEMGQPNFDFPTIPFGPSTEIKSSIEYSIPLGELVLPHVTTLSTGSAHSVIFVDELPDDATFTSLSAQIERHIWFPERTSIMWAKIVDEHNVRIRIWERGVQEANGISGETLACGTGACAVAVAAQITNHCGENVRVHSRGGNLKIDWKEGEEIQMTGAAQTVYEGVWRLHNG